MFYPLNSSMHFGSSSPAKPGGKAKTEKSDEKKPSALVWDTKSQASKPKVSPAEEAQSSNSSGKAKTNSPTTKTASSAIPSTPTQTPNPKAPSAKAPTTMEEHIDNMSEADRKKFIGKLLDMLSQQQTQLKDQQAHINEQQTQLNDYFQAYNQAFNNPEQLAHQPHSQQPFHGMSPEAASKAGLKAEPEKKASLPKRIASAPLRVLSALFPWKYIKNLPMNFLESFVQNAGATLGSRGADLLHEKVIHPTFSEKPPTPPKKSPWKESWENLRFLFPEIVAKSVTDNLAHQVARRII